MKKAEKEALQRKYTEDYLRTRIPLEAWCIENNYVYNSVRRFIKKPPKDAQISEDTTAQTAQKKVRKKTAQIAQNQKVKSPKTPEERVSKSDGKNLPSEAFSLSFNPADFGLSEKQGIFAENVAAGKKLVEAYRIAGYEGEGRTAHSNASRMLRNARVFRAVSFLRDKRQARLSLTEEEIIHQLSAIASANPAELVQFRRVNCRYCWGEHHLYQWRDIEEFDRAAEKASNDGKEEPEYGGLGFVESGFPNEDCPKCNGEGEGQFHAADTTQLEGDARWLYAGIKQTQNGLEVRMANQEAARRDLLKIIEARKNRTAKKTGEEPGQEENDITDEQLNDALRSLGYGRFSDQLSGRETPSDDQD